ncbi:hypothetical protein LCGC14_0428180 [marine sediment metagenome]|uniref:Uncharacterized protein n=1 Tax=marine sediment metagenome TaxID=412755 RepID=A0A0F9VY64_9ZZZZ
MSADINRARRRITAACREQGISRKKYKKNRRRSRKASAIKRGYLSVAAYAKFKKDWEGLNNGPGEPEIILESHPGPDAISDIPTSEAIAEVSFKPTWRLYVALAALAAILVALMIYVL